MIATILLLIYTIILPKIAFTNQIGTWATGSNVNGAIFITLAILFTITFYITRNIKPKKKEKIIPLPLIILILTQATITLSSSQFFLNQMAHGIDHGAFLYRIKEFFAIFPKALGSYSPYWNAGTEHFIGVTSGAHSFAILMAPFRLIMPFEYAYTFALYFYLVIGFPYLTAFTTRRMGVRLDTAYTAALIMLAINRAMYLFFWQSGNLGGMVTLGLTPSIIAISYRIQIAHRGTKLDTILLAILAFLSAIWSAGAFTLIGLAASWLLARKRWTKKSNTQIITAAILALILISPYLYVTLLPARGIVNYVTTTTHTNSIPQMFLLGITQLLRRITEYNPIILIFAPLALLHKSRLNHWTLPPIILLCLITIYIGFNLTSQLDRVAIQLSGVLLITALPTISRTLKNHYQKGIIYATLIITSAVATQNFANKCGFKLYPAPPALYEYANYLKSVIPEEGRLAFAGLTDCKLEWGKPTYLPFLTEREMMSDDYYGFPKGLTERAFPPKYYRKSTEDFIAYSDAYSITHWIVTDSRNKSFFDSHPDLFQEIDYRKLQSCHFYLYKRLNFTPSKTLTQNAKVTATFSKITIYPQSPGEIILRYNYRPGLYSPDIPIYPKPYDQNITFISLQAPSTAPITILYHPTPHKLTPNFDGYFHH